MPEAIYIGAFDVSWTDLRDKPLEEIIADYPHLEENVEAALEALHSRDAKVLQLVLGDGMTLRAAGDVLGLTSVRTGQILHNTLAKLRRSPLKRILDGSRRQSYIEAELENQREAAIREGWSKIQAEIEQQKNQKRAQLGAQLSRRLEELSISPVCIQKLHALGIRTAGELLEKFPYDPQTNGLMGLAIADGIGKIDYQEIWCALFTAGLFIRIPEPPDFDQLRKAEHFAMCHDDMTKITSTLIDDLDLSVRTYNCLKRNYIHTVGDILDKAKLSVDTFLKMDQRAILCMLANLKLYNFGQVIAKELAKRLYKLSHEDA